METVFNTLSAGLQSLCVCIPTFKRASLLKLLLADLELQDARPSLVIVVDGDPTSQEVLQALGVQSPARERIVYVASNHANLAYQRYLGWKAAEKSNAKILLYLDDDLRIQDRDSISKLLAPLRQQNSRVVGTTGAILFPKDRENDFGGAVRERAALSRLKAPLLVRHLGGSRGLPPGSLSPSGHRCPVANSGSEYAKAQWLRGGVMAYRMDALTHDCFSQDLFALSELGYGHGEDTLLSHRLSSRGELLMVSHAEFWHPCVDPPKAYSTRALKMGFGTAYSRRLLNDNYRWPGSPSFGDRLALLKSYAGTVLLNWSRALISPQVHRLAYAWGYTYGVWKGVLQPPTAQRLTPIVDWASDAHAALNAAKIITT